MLSGKISLKARPSQKIHAKIYIFRPDNFNEHTANSMITNSSNLTDAGLGTQQTTNYEFNVLLNDFKRLSYQIDAVNEGWKILKKHNGFFLSGVVGLSKTMIATLIATKDEYRGRFY